MKFFAAVFFCIGFLASANPQENSPAKDVAKSIGLPVGLKAPAFVAHDQFGHEQSNESLKGSNGTVLLFFRSADW